MSKPLLDVETQEAAIRADENLGLLDLPRITAQQRAYVAARVSGLSRTAASKAAGTSPDTAGKWEQDIVIQQYMAHYEEQMSREHLPRVKFGIEDAHTMYMKAYHMAATSAEMVKATDSLVKLHKVGESPAADVPTTVNAKQLADLPMSELMKLAQIGVEALLPEPLEGECVEVSE